MDTIIDQAKKYGKSNGKSCNNTRKKQTVEIFVSLIQNNQITLGICKTRDDLVAKTIESRLLNVSNLVTAEARYHVPCRTSFENFNTKINFI